jgi:hypothetical protein
MIALPEEQGVGILLLYEFTLSLKQSRQRRAPLFRRFYPGRPSASLIVCGRHIPNVFYK